MKITIKGFITSKESEKYSDCADHYAYNTKTNRFAISDGVGRSFFPEIWSQILVDNFVALQGETELSIEKCQSEWLKQVTQEATAPDAEWYITNPFNLQEPGKATFVSLRFCQEKWFGQALGDSFLFFVPKENECFKNWIKLSSKPEPVVFDNSTDYYSSRGNACGEIKSHEGNLESGTFLLMTDELAKWVFKEKENALKVVREKWVSQSEFESSVNELRKSQSMEKNDDSAILTIKIETDGDTEFHYECENVQDIKYLIEKEQTGQSETIKKDDDFVENVVKKQKNITTISENLKVLDPTDQTQAKKEKLSKNTKIFRDKCINFYKNICKTLKI